MKKMVAGGVMAAAWRSEASEGKAEEEQRVNNQTGR